MHLLAWMRHEPGGYASTPEVREAVEMNETTIRIFDKISSCKSSTLFIFFSDNKREKSLNKLNRGKRLTGVVTRDAGTGDMES